MKPSPEVSTVSVNNSQHVICPGTNLATLISDCGYEIEKSMFAVAVNSEFVPRECYSSYIVSSGDEIDVVFPISGG